MIKNKLIVFGGVLAAIAVASVIVAQAQTAALTVTCAGTVSGNQVMWVGTPTGGNAPYSLLWSGDGSVANSTSTSILATYTANGTYNAMVTATDASSTVATSTCQAAVTSIVTAAPTSTLNVVLTVNNMAGGSATPSMFNVSVNGGSQSSGSSTGTAFTVNAGTMYTVSASSIEHYSASKSGNCSGPIGTGESATCTVTETFVTSTVTPPTTVHPTVVFPPSSLPQVNQPSLSIGPNGAFLAHGMTVTSVGSGSFQGTVWGITYTVNWSNNAVPALYFREGNSAAATVNPIDQVNVGDEVGVSGKVASSSPLIVTGNVVRDYSITTARPGNREGQPTSPLYNGEGNGGVKNASSGTPLPAAATNIQAQINSIMNQLKSLQGMIHSNSGY